ncbi:hypothetical protein GF378_00605 [Candidatus Pacearchaeota archaeon]|nr:hypothetical protein [Candidatus Pacearchaeota archaeon]
MKSKTFLRVFFFIILFSVIFLGNINFVYCKEIQVDYPNPINLSEEFSFNLRLIDFEQDVYDVKIDILDKNNSERIAKILNNGEWKSTYYYIPKAINLSNSNEDTFFLKTIREFKKARIEIKIRDSKGKVNNFFNYNLEMDNETGNGGGDDGGGDDGGEDEEDYNNDKENESENDSNEYDNDESAQTDSVYYKIPSSNSLEEKQNLSKTPLTTNKITAPVIKIKREDEKEDAKSIKTVSDYALYGLGIFSILIILLMLIKFKIKNKNEFR